MAKVNGDLFQIDDDRNNKKSWSGKQLWCWNCYVWIPQRMNLHTSIIFYVVYGRPEKGTRANSWQSTLTLDKVLVPVKLLHARVVHSSCLACYVWLLNIVLFTTTNLNLDLQLFFRKLKIIRLLTFKLFRWIDSWFFIICIFTCDLPPPTHTHTRPVLEGCTPTYGWQKRQVT